MGLVDDWTNVPKHCLYEPTPFASEDKNRPILEDNSEVNENDFFYLTQKKCR